MEDTSLSLLGRISENSDPESWGVLTDLYGPWLRGWLRKSGLQESDADDVVQDVLVVLARELPGFCHSGRPGAFRAWLHGILVNRLRDVWRRARYRPAAPGGTACLESLQQLADPQSGLSRLWRREHDQHVLHKLLKRIELRFAASTLQAFRRVVLDNVEAGQVAQEMGLSLNAVVIAKCRVLKELRREGRGLLDD